MYSDYDDIKFRAGNEMNSLETISNAFLEIENGLITDFGDMDQWKGIDDWNNTEIIDAENGMVFPSYCDSHTHLVFAQTRESEFNDRINGLSYQEIANNGGGILNSAKKIDKISEDELYNLSNYTKLFLQRNLRSLDQHEQKQT